jgi:FPC/CPF motif-containing protein YcgG
MANVLEVMGYNELCRLKDLSERLDGILSVIAYDDKAKDLNYIKECQKELKDEYSSMVKLFKECIHLHAHDEPNSKLLTGIECIVDCYYGFQYILDDENIEQEAQDLLHGNLLMYEDAEE